MEPRLYCTSQKKVRGRISYRPSPDAYFTQLYILSLRGLAADKDIDRF